jgi:positive regulator of sigma E activity
MKKKDAIYYMGFFAGMIVGVKVMQQLGYGDLIGMLGGVVCGVGLGYMAERAFTQEGT